MTVSSQTTSSHMFGVSAQEHGDARRASTSFDSPARSFRDDDADHVREEHVRCQRDDAEVTRIQDLIRGCPAQAKVADCRARRDGRIHEPVSFQSNQKCISPYRRFAEAIDTNVLGQKRITDQLSGVRDALKIIDMTER